MATSEQIRNRIIELVKDEQFLKKDLLQIFAQLVHEGILDNNEIIDIVKYLFEDILNAQTRTSYANSHKNKFTGKKLSYNSYQFAPGKRFELRGKEYICDND